MMVQDKIKEYSSHLADGTLSNDEFSKLLGLLFTQASAEGGISGIDEFEEIAKETIYQEGLSKMKDHTADAYHGAIALFGQIEGWKDASVQIQKMQKELPLLEAEQEERRRLEAKKKIEADTARVLEQEKKKKILRIAIVAVVAICLLASAVVMINANAEKRKYKQGIVGATYELDFYVNDYTDATIQFKENGEYVIQYNGHKYTGQYSIKKKTSTNNHGDKNFVGFHYIKLSPYPEDHFMNGELYLIKDFRLVEDDVPADYTPGSFTCYDEEGRTMVFTRK